MTIHRARLLAAGGLIGAAALAASIPSPGAVADQQSHLYRGHVQVVDGPAADARVLVGSVFDDRNRNSAQDRSEKGLSGVTVSNGREVVSTDAEGRYRLPVRDNMTVFVTQPAGWQVPVDETRFAQFSWNHLPAGSPALKYGGIAPTGPLPKAVNFPLTRAPITARPTQHCPIASDTQTYDLTEVGYARDGAVADLAARDDYAGCGVLLLGDNVGDDLSLNDELKDIYRDTNGAIRTVPGNHDMDLDATSDEHSLDTYRRDFGASYYSYDIGQAHVVVLDSIHFPLPAGSTRKYDEVIDADQLAWLRKDLATVPRSKQIVLATHAPIVSYTDVVVDNAAELYRLLKGRRVVTVGGHTHTLENLRPGDSRAEWKKWGVQELPFTQLVAGAVSGNWYSGALNENGLPYSFMTDGAQPGVLTLDLRGSDLSWRYDVRNEPASEQLFLGLNTPAWRDWAERAKAARSAKQDIPALGDEGVVERSELGDSWLTANLNLGSTASTVRVSIDGSAPKAAQHTQPARGEALRKGWEWADPRPTTRNLQSSGGLTEASPHLWRFQLPTGLSTGTHSATVSATDDFGRTSTRTLRFTVVDERPAQ